MPEFDWTKYEQLRDSGLSEHAIYRTAVADGHRPFPDCIKMLIDVFGVDLTRAKEIYLQALDAYQASLIPDIEAALEMIDEEEKRGNTEL